MADGAQEFLFNVEKFFGSTSVRRMSFAEKGVYLVMLFEQWRAKEKNLPDNAADVAELIAVTPSQAAEVEAAWDVVRRKFVTSKHSPDRIYNVEIEHTRRVQRRKFRTKQIAGRAAGKASAAKRQRVLELPSNDRSTVVEQTSTAVNSKDRLGQDRLGQVRRGESVPRAHTGTVFEGSLPRDHRDHVYCDPTFSVCVPPAVHAKFIGPLSRKFGGDRQKAQDALLSWYAAVVERLPPECVMGDAFKFWQPRFDVELATAPISSGPRRLTEDPDTMNAGVADLLRKKGVIGS